MDVCGQLATVVPEQEAAHLVREDYRRLRSLVKFPTATGANEGNNFMPGSLN